MLRVFSSLYTSSLSSCTANLPHLGWCTPMFQQPPIPRSFRSGIRWMRRLSSLNSSMASVVPSVEWLSMMMRLYLKSVFWFSTDLMASRMVRMRFRTGMMTEASYSKLPAENSICLNSGSRYQMLGAGFFHLNLAVTVSGIDVIEYFLTAFAVVVLYFTVKVFIDMHQF